MMLDHGAPRTSAGPRVQRLGGTCPDALARTPGGQTLTVAGYIICYANNIK